MRVFVDISLLTPVTAIGRVSGPMEFLLLPRIGELVSLSRAVVQNAGFSGQLAVQHVIHSPFEAGQEPEPLLSLTDIVSPTPEAAASIGQALEQFYGLYFEPYER